MRLSNLLGGASISGYSGYSGPGASAAGSNTQVQYNSSGSFAGSSNLTFDGTTLTAAAVTSNGTLQAGKSSANYVQAVGAVTTLEPVISVVGSDTNVPLLIKTQGTGAIDLAPGSGGVNVSNGGTMTAITRTAGGYDDLTGNAAYGGYGAGGSGIVVIRYADTYKDATSTTGSPTFTNTGGYKIYKWTGSGSITF